LFIFLDTCSHGVWAVHDRSLISAVVVVVVAVVVIVVAGCLLSLLFVIVVVSCFCRFL